MTQTSATEATPRSQITVVVAIVVGVLIVGLGIVFAGRFGTDVTVAASPLIGEPVPDLTLPFLEEDGEMSFTDMRGEILVINFWASWCLACREEHGALVAASTNYADFGVTFIGVNYQDSLEPAQQFLDELGRGDEYVYVVDDDSTAGFALGVLGIPETFFVDRDGIIVGKISGPTTYELLSRTLDNIIVGKAVDSVKTGEVQNR